MKKVAIVYHYFAHYRTPVFRALADSSTGVEYYFLGDPVPSDDIKRIDFNNEVKLSERFIPLKNIWFWKQFLWQKGLLSGLRKNNFDAVIFLGDIKFISTWLAVVFTRLRGKKAYLWGHGLYGRESWLNLKLKLLFLRLSNGIFLYNNRAKDLYIKNGVSSNKLIVIYNSLNFDETEHYRKQYNVLNNSELPTLFSDPKLPVALYIGRVNKDKNINMLIQSLSILKERNIHLNCLIVGDGNDKSDLENMVKELDLEGQVYFAGAKYMEQDISQYMMISDVCVCPGPIGLTGIHALSYGIPAISNNNFNLQGPEHEAIIPGKTGDFFLEGDIEDLSEKIYQCILMRKANKEKNVQHCLSDIHTFYNPGYQRDTINKTILGKAVNDATPTV